MDNLGRRFIDFLFPKKCIGCGEYGALICHRCRLEVRFLTKQPCAKCLDTTAAGFTHERCMTKYAPDRFLSVLPYFGAVRNGLLQLKYEQVLILKDFFIGKVEEFLEGNRFYIPKDFTVIPVPMHSKKKRQRTFNQSEEFGKELAERRGLEFSSRFLLKVVETDSQTKMEKKKDRTQNVKGVFEVPEKVEEDLEDRNILLFDDVWTTGATAREAVRTLKKSGAGKVWVLTVARG